MAQGHQLGRRIFGQEHNELAKHARDVQLVFDRLPVHEHRVVEATYTEPMVMRTREEPFGVELLRITDLINANTPVTACNGMVHYTWNPTQGGCVINNIGGMTVAANGGVRYRFTYRITYRMVEEPRG